jgi:thiamine biosynthesis protein ThiS
MGKNILNVKINGFDCLVKEPLSILEFLNYIGFNKNVVVIDYNGYILESSLWIRTSLCNNDSLEILSMAGGG